MKLWIMEIFALNKLTQKLFAFCFPISKVDNLIVRLASTENTGSFFSQIYGTLMTILSKTTISF